MVHVTKVGYKCPECAKDGVQKIFTFKFYGIHYGRYHCDPRDSPPGTVPVWKCHEPDCPALFYDEDQARKHFKAHCHICNKTLEISSYRGHRKRGKCRPVERFECPGCGKQYLSKDAVKRHTLGICKAARKPEDGSMIEIIPESSIIEVFPDPRIVEYILGPNDNHPFIVEEICEDEEGPIDDQEGPFEDQDNRTTNTIRIQALL